MLFQMYQINVVVLTSWFRICLIVGSLLCRLLTVKLLFNLGIIAIAYKFETFLSIHEKKKSGPDLKYENLKNNSVFLTKDAYMLIMSQ